MTDNSVSTVIQLLGKPYSIKSPESALQTLQQAAEYLDKQTALVKDSGKAINLERIAIITALNIAHQLLQMDHQKSNMVTKINQRISELQDKLESAMHPQQTELVYTTE